MANLERQNVLQYFALIGIYFLHLLLQLPSLNRLISLFRWLNSLKTIGKVIFEQAGIVFAQLYREIGIGSIKPIG